MTSATTEPAAAAPTLVHDLDLPTLDVSLAVDAPAIQSQRMAAAEQGWLARTGLGYCVLHYADVVVMLRDKRWHSASGRILELSGVTDPAYLERRRTSILSAEGVEHTRLRRLVGKAFSPRAADRLRPFMRDVIERLVGAVAASGRCDFARDVAEQYPIPIICELLGAPQDDWQLFSRWAGDILRIFNMNLHQDLPTIVAAMDELDEYTRRLIAERRNTPADDLLTDLIAAEEEGDRLSTDELVMMVEAVILGGTDTTRNQLGCAIALFAEHPDQWQLLADRPDLAARAVEEVMRWSGAVRGTGRFASEDIVHRDVLFPAGTFVALAFSSANRDAAVFGSSAEVFDIERVPSGQPHLTFGSGIHYCLGAALARAELQEALPVLARRLTHLAVDGEVTWKPSLAGIFGPERLPIRFDPAP